VLSVNSAGTLGFSVGNGSLGPRAFLEIPYEKKNFIFFMALLCVFVLASSQKQLLMMLYMVPC
jgi:hypothetical protein